MSEITTAEELPADDARTAWEREALDRFLRSAPAIPEHIFKNFEVALWGACHVLLLMRPDAPAGATVTREAVEAMVYGLYPAYIAVEADVPRAAHRLTLSLTALGVTVTDGPSEGGADRG